MADQSGQLKPDGTWLWNGTEWVPNLAMTGQSPEVAWARPYESPRHRAMFLTIFLFATIVAFLVEILVDILLIGLVAQESEVSDAQYSFVEILNVVSLILYYATSIPAFVFLCMWVHRIVRNMPALGSPDARWSPSGAVWRSVLPVFSWFHPLRSTLDAWRASDLARRFMDVTARKAIGAPMLFWGWWALWLIGNYGSALGDRLIDNDSFDVARAGVWINGLGDVLLIVATGLAIVVVNEVTARQDRKSQLIASGQLV